ncbi:MAG: hypothetical protein U0359_01035 [Byssovorax sp.]
MKPKTTAKPRRKKTSADAAAEPVETTTAAAPEPEPEPAPPPPPPEPPSTTVTVGATTWTIPATAPASLVRALKLPEAEAADALQEMLGEVKRTNTRAQQEGCEIWRASSRWHRLRLLVERLGENELKLREVLPHTDWEPPGMRPPPPQPRQVHTPLRMAPPQRPAQRPPQPRGGHGPRPPKESRPAPSSSPPEPPVLVLRRPGSPPAVAPEPPPSPVSVASALSTRQLLALHAALADFRRGGVWPGLTKLAAATELPRSQAGVLATELERLNIGQRNSPVIAEVRGRVLRALQQELRAIPVASRPDPRVHVDLVAERICVVTVTADFDVVDALVDALVAAKGDGVTRLPRGARAVIRA